METHSLQEAKNELNRTCKKCGSYDRGLTRTVNPLQGKKRRVMTEEEKKKQEEAEAKFSLGSGADVECIDID